MRKPLLLSILFAFALCCSAQTTHVFTPENNSTIDKLSVVTIEFDESEVADMYQSESFKGRKWAVFNEEGDSVAGAYIFDYECPQAILKIQPNIYAEGKYTVNLPEGYLWLYDSDDNKSLAPAETLTFNVTGNEQQPEMNINFFPSPSEPIGYLSSVSFRVDGYSVYNNDVNNGQKITVTDASGEVVANGQAEYSYTDSCGIVTLDKTVATAGTYTIHIPDNIFRIATDWLSYYSGDYEMLPATDVTYTVEGSDVTIFDVSGDGTSSVPAIKLTFPQHSTVMLNGDKDYICYTIYTSDGHYGSFTATWDSLITTKDNVLTLQLYSPQITPDTYKFTIPEGDLIFEDGSYNTPLAVTFTVTEPKETQVTSAPADNSTVNELYALDVTFTDATYVRDVYDFTSYAVTDSQGNDVTDAEGNELSFIVDAIKGNTVSMRLSNGDDYTILTTPGTYHVTLPRSYFFINEDLTEVSGKIELTFNIVEGEDTHTYVPWGYYNSDDISSLGAIGTTESNTYDVAIFIPGDGMLHGAKLAGAKVPVRDTSVLTSLKAWVATSLNGSYLYTADINNPHMGYNTVRFDDTFTVPAEGCYVGYTICVDNDTPMGVAYPVVYDESVKLDHSLYMSIPGYGWFDYGPAYGISALQGLFQDLDLSEASASFGSVDGGMTEKGTTSDWSFPLTTSSASDVNMIEYEIDIDGETSNRTAVVNIPAGDKQQSKMTVSIDAPDETGTYNVRLTVTKINGKDNAMKTTSVSTFTNVEKTVTRHTVVEELTGTGCGWCPRGFIGLQNVNRAYDGSVICLAYHRYNSSDPMWCNYASTDDLFLDYAPMCAIDRKGFCDPYAGDASLENGIVDQVSKYLAIPAPADISMKATWTTADCKEVRINATLEAFTDDKYELVYVLTADSLYAESTSWRQTNYYAEKEAEYYPEDLALFCEGGEYGTNPFKWAYDDVVIGSSYDEDGLNTSSDSWQMKSGDIKQGSFVIALPEEGVIVDAIRGSIDKVYAVVFALDGKRQIAQAAKVNVVEIETDGIEEIENGGWRMENSSAYNLAGQRINANARGIIIQSGRKYIK